MESFSNKIKQELVMLSPKVKQCCMYSFLYGLTFPYNNDNGIYTTFSTNVKNILSSSNEITNFLVKRKISTTIFGKKSLISSDFVKYFTIAEIKSGVFKCSHCQEHFYKGMFFSSGTANSLEKASRLELVFENYDNAIDTKAALEYIGISFNISKRNEKTILYIKRSEIIEDFLALIGANTSAFEMINRKINNEVRNTANRATNCDAANINKSLNASKKYIDAINEIISSNRFDGLSSALQEIANLRLEYPDISIEELGKKLTPKISKSGVHHRLENILKYSKETEN